MPSRSSKDELGVIKYCFGEYLCTTCNRKWESTRAWKNFGQKCRSCEETIEAKGLHLLFYYMCKPCNLSSNGKTGYWKWKYCEKGRPCMSCKSIVKPFLSYSEFNKTRRLWGEGGRETKCDPKIPHKQEMCQKCIAAGKDCRLTGGKIAVERECGDEKEINSRSSKQLGSKLKLPKQTNTKPDSVPLTASFTSTYTGGFSMPGLSYRSVASIGIASNKTPNVNYDSDNSGFSSSRRWNRELEQSSSDSESENSFEFYNHKEKVSSPDAVVSKMSFKPSGIGHTSEFSQYSGYQNPRPDTPVTQRQLSREDVFVLVLIPFLALLYGIALNYEQNRR